MLGTNPTGYGTNRMQRIKAACLALLAGLSLLWWLANDFTTGSYSRFWPLRADMVQYTGVLAIAAMSGAMLLAIRPRRIERLFDGLDKTYRLHKWLGIAALALGVVHWGWAQVPKWLVGLGWLERPLRAGAEQAKSGLAAWQHSQRGLAEDIGEWAFYSAVVLLTLALLKRIPYRWFFRTHRWLALVYLALVIHSLILMQPAYWRSALGPVMALLLLAGSLAGLVSLARRIGRRRQVIGHIHALHHHADNHVLRVDITLDGPWPGHQAGQFAFVTFDEREGPHPFSLSSAWCNDGKLAFAIKGLGDYTRTLPERLSVGDPVRVEGPYGCFDFKGRKRSQIWVAGGIGIAPFIARLQALANGSADGGGNVDLFYSTNAPDQDFIERIRQLAERAHVRLHLMIASEHGRLTPERLRQQIPHWLDCDFWFCGPSGFARDLRRDLQSHGLAQGDFHQELFNMR